MALWEVLQRMDYLIKRVFSKRNRPTYLPALAIEQANQEVRQEDRHRQTRLVSRARETKPHVFMCIKCLVISVHLNSVFFNFVY